MKRTETPAGSWIATRPTFRIQTDARTGRRYQLQAVLSATGSFMQAATGRRYNVVRTWIDLSVGDAVRHGDTGEIGVIVNDSYSRTQVEVNVWEIDPSGREIDKGVTAVWYVSRLTTV